MSIQDSITGDYLKLGHRVNSISTGYKLAHRFSDMTYSGVYNRESNVNNLNEFNLGLLNFKTLEPFYGSIQYLYPRDSDILAFQEDKVSKVLFGKNILSDAVGGSVLASIPEVLGNQIPRPEEYGIDIYPETFVSYGDKIYFTDAKRGAVIQMSGESMTRISDIGMISYFRDALIKNNGLKRGGYDPYMRDYVFHFGDPVASIENLQCGTTFYLAETDPSYQGGIIRFYYNFDYPNPSEGDSDVQLTLTGGNNVIWEAWYGGTMIDQGLIDIGSPTYSFTAYGINQSNPYLEIRINSYDNGTAGACSVSVDCLSNATVIPVMIVLSDGADAGKLATQVVGPSLTQNYQFEIQLSASGEYFNNQLPATFLGTQMFPQLGGTLNMYSLVYPGGLSPNTTDSRFKLLLSNTAYPPEQATTVSSLAGSTTLVADNNSFSPLPAFVSSSPRTLSSLTTYAYFVWDYRTQGIAVNVCEGASINVVCCQSCFDPDQYINTNVTYNAYGGYGICDSSYNLVIYRSSNTLIVGSKLMLDVGATIPAPPGWYKVYDGANKVAQVGALGVISLIQNC